MKFKISKKQKKIIILAVILGLVVIVSLIFFFNRQNHSKQNVNLGSDFLDKSEKINLNIKPETKIQVLKRDASGNIVLYKVIRNDSDIITDLNQIKAETPREQR
jgi:hypothetical protein